MTEDPSFTVHLTVGLIGAVLLAVILFWLAAAVFVMTNMSDSSAPSKTIGNMISAALFVGALLLVCAGGGWL